MTFQLSILIPSIPERASKFEELEKECYRQANGLPGVEIVSEISPHVNRGGVNIPTKRKRLYERARGKYAVQFDDDDMIKPGMVDMILEAAERDPDCITYDIIVIEPDDRTTLAHVSASYSDWETLAKPDSLGYSYYQGPYFKVPIRTSICLRAGINLSLNMGEDYDFMKRVCPLIKTGIWLNSALYIYNAPKSGTKYERYGA